MFKNVLKTITVLVLAAWFITPTFAQEAEKERAEYKMLLIQNPNYFGTFPTLDLTPIKPMKSNTKYEQIKCVGFHPDEDLLKAVIQVKLTYGYKGGLCTSTGSYEYVRFYADWNKDGDFSDADEDLGLTSVNVHDIPNFTETCGTKSKPLWYAVSLKIKPPRDFCNNPKLVKVRAILSWEYPPPPGNPGFNPPWGNRLQRWIQIKPKHMILKQIVNPDFIKEMKLDPSLYKLDIPLESLQKALPPEKLKTMYADTEVSELRFNYAALEEKLKLIEQDPGLMIKYQEAAKLVELSKTAKAGEIMPISQSLILQSQIYKNIQDLLVMKYNTTYEQLTCAGLKYETDTLAATVWVKKPSGYCGNLCTWAGSYEYVAFWAYVWDEDSNKCDWKYLGTARVNVFDIPNIPNAGLRYAVNLRTDLTKYKRPKCAKYPAVIKIRAMLSWNSPPAWDKPNAVPRWGNVIDRFIQLKPLEPGVIPGDQVPFISTVGDMAVTTINSSGYATGAAVTSGFTANNSPFGAMVSIAGHISNAPNLSAGDTPLKYRVYYRRAGTTLWHRITNKFRIYLSEWDGYTWTQSYHDQQVDSADYYEYQEDLAINPPSDLTQTFVEGFVMAKWYTQGLTDGLYEIKITAITSTGPKDSNIVNVRLDNTKPTAKVWITQVIAGGVGPPTAASDCGVFQITDIIKGKYNAWDAHFKNFSFAVHPSKYNPNPVSPSSGTTGGFNLDWLLNTNGANPMTPCGYTVHIHVYDRTIVNSGYIGWYAHDSTGFCLKE